jgi:hypothetical protein
MDYELGCPICLSKFKLPTHNPRDIKWSYKSLGPFALPKQGYGAYSVLLAVHFLSSHHHPATTPVFSFHANRAGHEIEADFMMFYRDSAFWERETEVIASALFRRRPAERIPGSSLPASENLHIRRHFPFALEEEDALARWIEEECAVDPIYFGTVAG